MKVTIEQLIGYLRQRGFAFQWLYTMQHHITAYNRWLDRNAAAVQEALKPLNEEQKQEALVGAFHCMPEIRYIEDQVKRILGWKELCQWRATRGW